MASNSPLLDLPEDIRRSISEQLSLSDFYSLGNFRLCSRTCNALAEVFFYRTVSFHEMKDPEKSAKLIVGLAKRLTDLNDPLIRYVRHLKIGPTRELLPSNEERRRLPYHEYRSLPKGLLVQHVIGILEHLSHLTDFSWHIYNKVPKDILDRIKTWWPNCRLHAYYPDANHRKQQDFDNDFLSSPQLHTLEIQPINFSDPRDGWGQLEFAHLGHLLGKHGCLKILRLLQPKEVNPSSHIGAEYGNDPVWLEPDKLKFPVLEELVIPQVVYREWYHGPLKLGHEWWNLVDWSHITKLNVGNLGHEWSNFLVGRVAQVRSLGFKYSSWDANQSTDVGHYVNNAKNLLAHISELQEVRCVVQADRDDSNWADIWDTLLLKHGKSLRKLAISHQRFTAGTAKLLIDQAPNLEELDVVIRVPGPEKDVFNKDHGITDIFRYEEVETLVGLSCLRHLKLTIPMALDDLGLMGYEARSDHSPNDLKIVRDKDCEQHMGAVFAAFLKHQAQSCNFDIIEVQFYCAAGRRSNQDYLIWAKTDSSKSWKAVIQRNYTTAWGDDDEKPYSVRFQIAGDDLVLRKIERKE